MENESWYQRLERIAKEKHLTKRELRLAVTAQVEPVSESTVSRWFKGKAEPCIAQLEVISRLLNISLDELIFGQPYGGEPDAEITPTDKRSEQYALSEDLRHILWVVENVGTEEALGRLLLRTAGRPRAETSND